MKNTFSKLIFIGMGSIGIYSCIETYLPPVTKAEINFLVIDGFLNTGSGSSTIKLTRTQPINSSAVVGELKAKVQIEDQDGVASLFTEGKNGEYILASPNLNPIKKYRLRIRTKDNKEYLSDLVPIRKTPPIDAITFGPEGENIRINVSTHDPADNTRYYRWRFEETWQYQSMVLSLFKSVKQVITPRTEEVYNCWKTVSSANIEIGSSFQLSKDVISNNQLLSIPRESNKLRLGYSILVHQYALTKEAFEYWQELKKSAGNLGTIFAPQPSQIRGNIHSVSNPEEPVMGFFSAYSVEDKRIFFTHNDLPQQSYYVSEYDKCAGDTIPVSLWPSYYSYSSLANQLYLPNGVVYAYVISTEFCIDCRLNGGVNKKPDFWE